MTVPDRRESILRSIRSEDPEFAIEVEKCIFEFEEFLQINDMILTDIIFGMKDDMRSVAIALYKCKDENLLAKFVKNMLPAQGAAFRDETNLLDKITVGQQRGARFKVIEKARELEHAGTIQLKKYSPNYRDDK